MESPQAPMTIQRHSEKSIRDMVRIMQQLEPARTKEECERIAHEYWLAKWALKIAQVELAISEAKYD